jgi:hypothetical protein
MNTTYRTPSKRVLVSWLISLCLLPASCSAGVLAVSQCTQERTNWCWAASSQSVLAYYGTHLTQTEIAQYGTGGRDVGNQLSGRGPDWNGVNWILWHFGNISSVYWPTNLEQSWVPNIIDANFTPIVIQ